MTERAISGSRADMKAAFLFWVDIRDGMLSRIDRQHQRMEQMKRAKNEIQRRAIEVEFLVERDEIPEQVKAINGAIGRFNSRAARMGINEVPQLPNLGAVETRQAPATKTGTLEDRLAVIRRRAAAVCK